MAGPEPATRGLDLKLTQVREANLNVGVRIGGGTWTIRPRLSSERDYPCRNTRSALPYRLSHDARRLSIALRRALTTRLRREQLTRVRCSYTPTVQRSDLAPMTSSTSAED